MNDMLNKAICDFHPSGNKQVVVWLHTACGEHYVGFAANVDYQADSLDITFEQIARVNPQKGDRGTKWRMIADTLQTNKSMRFSNTTMRSQNGAGLKISDGGDLLCLSFAGGKVLGAKGILGL